ncbi:hypothetical protein [Streptomyces sp. NPDC004528]|uniref:hypothetical protein n=1 Tax=Streptomyces sp. NPDC004528 TaxID=3154550 RepID=UPI0033A21EC1
MTRKTAAIALVAALAGASLTACGMSDKYTQPWQDAPRSGTDNGAATIITMPDGFNNLATKCITGTGIRATVIYHQDSDYGAVSTVADPTCH